MSCSDLDEPFLNLGVAVLVDELGDPGREFCRPEQVESSKRRKLASVLQVGKNLFLLREGALGVGVDVLVSHGNLCFVLFFFLFPATSLSECKKRQAALFSDTAVIRELVYFPKPFSDDVGLILSQVHLIVL